VTIEQRSAASGPGAVARQKGVGDEPVLEAPRHGISPEAGGYGLLGYSVLFPVQDRPTHLRVGGVALSVAVERDEDLRGRAGRRPCQLVCGERGKRPGGARRSPRGFGAGAPSAVAVGAWRRTRSSRSRGKPGTWRRGPVSMQHRWLEGVRR
jgi:hypothetical protein